MADTDAQDIAVLNDILNRRRDARGGGAEIEATTFEDIDAINSIVLRQSPMVRLLISTHDLVWGDFGNGRCSVCGMTGAQAEAVGYDCAEIC